VSVVGVGVGVVGVDGVIEPFATLKKIIIILLETLSMIELELNPKRNKMKLK